MKNSTTPAHVNERETVRLDADVRRIFQSALDKLSFRNKNLIMNACLREGLKRFAGKRVPVVQSDFERSIFAKPTPAPFFDLAGKGKRSGEHRGTSAGDLS